MGKKTCTVVGCWNRTGDSEKIRLLRFPKDKKRKKLWCDKLGLISDNLNEDKRICSEHFTPDDFYSTEKRVWVKKNAVPNRKNRITENNRNNDQVPMPLPIFVSHPGSRQANIETDVVEFGQNPTLKPKIGLTELEGYSKSKLLLDELYIIFNICKPECSICDQYILQLSRHVQNKHHRAQDENENGHSESDSETIVPDQVPIRKPHTRTYRSESGSRLRTEQGVNYAELLGNNDTGIKIHTYDEDLLQNEESPIANPTEIITAHVGEPESDPLGDCPNLDPDFDVNLDIDIDCVVKVEEELKVDLGYDYNVGAICEILPPTDSASNFECRTESNTISTVNPKKSASASKMPTTVSVCNICQRRFTDLKYLNDHLRRVHKFVIPVIGKTYVCDICKENFNSKPLLCTHVLTHGERPYICQTCNKNFRTRDNLKEHEKSHNSEYKVQCEEWIGRRKRLKVHMVTHSDFKKIICEICGKGFNIKAQLQQHMLTHTGEKPYECEICKKAFSLKLSLRDHIKVHTGERSFVCDTCGKSYKWRKQLVIHMRSHTGEKPYVCKFCSKGFTSRPAQTDHMKRHHDYVEPATS